MLTPPTRPANIAAMDGSDPRCASAAQRAPWGQAEPPSEPPFALIEPLRRTTPLIFCSPHSGRRYPPEFLAQTRVGLLSLRRSEDAYVDELFASGAAHGAAVLSGSVARAYIDLNRDPAELDPDMFEERLPRATASARVQAGLGAIPRISGDGQTLYRRKLTLAEAERRIATVYRPYHAMLSNLLDQTKALFGCAVLTGVGAALNTAQVFPGARVAVVGLGGVGLNAMFGAQVAGASQVVAVDIHDDKLELARKLGATDVVNAKDPDAVQKIKEITGGGADFGLEMAGSVQAMELAYRATRRGGTTVTAGLPHPDARWPLQHVNLTAEERTVKGSYVGSCVPPRDMPRYIELYRKGMLPVNKLLSDRITLDQIDEGFDRLASGHTVRQIVMI